MTYSKQIDIADRLITKKGRSCTIIRYGEATVVSYSENDFGTLSASGKVLTFESNHGGAVLVGDQVEFREVSEIKNRGPFTVDAVGDDTITVDDDLQTAADETWLMDVRSNDTTETTGDVVTLPPQSITKSKFEQDFRSGTLQVSRAHDVLLSAKGLGFGPRPGDRMVLDGDTWIIHGIGALNPDGTAIVWEGVITKG